MKSFTVSAELAASVQRMREARPWLEATARFYEAGLTPSCNENRARGRRRRPSKRMRAALKKMRSA